MKKTSLIVCVLACATALVLLATLLIPSRPPVRGTFDISNEERELLQASDTAVVRRFFRGDLEKAFADYDNIDDIIRNGAVETYYMIDETEGDLRTIFKAADYTTRVNLWVKVWIKPEEVTKAAAYLGDDVMVYDAYLFDDSNSDRASGYMTPVLCLKTNKGEYVSYNFWIMSMEAFHKYCQCRELTPEDTPPSSAYNWDFTVYMRSHENFNPDAPIPPLPVDEEEVLLMVGSVGGVVLLVLGTPVIVFAIKHKKKKAALAVSAEPTTEQTE